VINENVLWPWFIIIVQNTSPLKQSTNGSNFFFLLSYVRLSEGGAVHL
jgi:hypothetical protein